MIKKVKYAVFAVLTMLMIVFCGETAYYRLTDRAGNQFKFLSFERVYDSDSLTADIKELAEKYDCMGYFPIYEYGNYDKEIYCCTAGDIPSIQKKLGIKDCKFNTITNGSYCFEFTEISSDTNTYSDKIITGFYLDEASGSAVKFRTELSEKYDFDTFSGQESSHYEIYVIICCILFVLLLSVYDVMSMKREVCIRLTLGRSISGQILKYQLTDIIVFFSIGAAMAVVFYSFTAVVLIIPVLIKYLILLSVFNSIVFVFFYAVDICSTLKKSNDSAVFLPFNYLLKFISSTLLILLVILSAKFVKYNERCKAAEEFQQYFRDYQYIELSESPYWAALIDNSYSGSQAMQASNSDVINLITQEFEDYTDFFSAVNQKTDTFMLNAFNGYDTNTTRTLNVVLASNCADKYIEEQTNTELSDEKITLLIPDTYYYADLNICKKWLKEDVLGEKYDDMTEIINYKKANIAVFGYTDYSEKYISNYDFNILSSPIVIYVPHAEDYSFFDTQQLAVNTDKNTAEEILEELNIRSTALDVSSVSLRSQEYIKQLTSILVIFILLLCAAVVYNASIYFSTVTLDILINRKDRAILKILGRTFIFRHFKTYSAAVLSVALSAIAASLLASALGIFDLQRVLIVSVVMITIDILFFTIIAYMDVKKNTVKSLKGGAL